jgi:Protein of unknown function (DUF2934)
MHSAAISVLKLFCERNTVNIRTSSREVCNMPETKNPIAPTEEQIRERAYEIYLARGCETGHEISDWLAAEHELVELTASGPATIKKARSAAAS